MAIPCFVIVAAIAVSSPALAPKHPAASAAAATATIAMSTTATPSSAARIARAVLEPPPMSRGRRCAHLSVRHLAPDR